MLLNVLFLGSCKTSRRTTTTTLNSELVRTQNKSSAGIQSLLQNDSSSQSWQWNIRISDTITWVLTGADSIPAVFSDPTQGTEAFSGNKVPLATLQNPVRLQGIRNVTISAGGTKQSTASSRQEKTEESTVLRTDTSRLHAAGVRTEERTGGVEGRWKNPFSSLIIPFMVLLALSVYLLKKKK